MSTTNHDLIGMKLSANYSLVDDARRHMINAYEAYTSGKDKVAIISHIAKMESQLTSLSEECGSDIFAEDIIHQDMPISEKSSYFVTKFIDDNPNIF